MKLIFLSMLLISTSVSLNAQKWVCYRALINDRGHQDLCADISSKTALEECYSNCEVLVKTYQRDGSDQSMIPRHTYKITVSETYWTAKEYTAFREIEISVPENSVTKKPTLKYIMYLKNDRWYVKEPENTWNFPPRELRRAEKYAPYTAFMMYLTRNDYLNAHDSSVPAAKRERAKERCRVSWVWTSD